MNMGIFFNVFHFAVWQIVVEKQQKEFALVSNIQSGHPSSAQNFQVRPPYNNIAYPICGYNRRRRRWS